MSDRETILALAQSLVGVREGSWEHHKIIDIYNNHRPLARGYKVQYTDAWCATFISTLAITTGLTDIIPTECGCEEQIKLFQQLGEWVEDDAYIPKPGDIIYYDWQDSGSGDNTGHSDHIGIVESCDGINITVIEGNYSDQVKRRIIGVGSRYIRGYGVPRYKGDEAHYTLGWNHDSIGWWYATSESTYHKSTWSVINHHKYYFGDDGYMLTGLQEIGGKYYYLTESGDLEGALCRSGGDGSLTPWFI